MFTFIPQQQLLETTTQTIVQLTQTLSPITLVNILVANLL